MTRAKQKAKNHKYRCFSWNYWYSDFYIFEIYIT